MTNQNCCLLTYAAGPLDGIKVLDITRVLAGPFCAMLLGDLGAEVIKVERPGHGDDTRHWPPLMGTESTYFMSVNRNKKSIAVDLKAKEGQEIIKKLALHCDILLHNYMPGGMEHFGLGYEDLAALNPALIYCSITGFGETGPHADRGGYDVIASGVAGLMHLTGPKDGAPVKVGLPMTDLSTALYAHGAVMAALLSRHRTGKGQKLQCNLLQTQVSLLVYVGSNYLNLGIQARRCGTEHPSIVPYQGFGTADGQIIIGAGNDNLFSALCEIIGLPHLATDEKYSTNENRVKNREELVAILSKRFSEHGNSHWLKLLERSKIPFGPVNSIPETFSDLQVQHLGMVRSIKHPTVGEVKFTGPAVTYGGFDQPTRLPPPILGQHTREVLQSLDYDDDRISRLQHTGIIQIWDS
ncbi:hypothetical protein EMCRGX_G013341 [Ephydatia muelleri]